MEISRPRTNGPSLLIGIDFLLQNNPMVTLHANPPLQLQFATRLEAECFAEKQNLDANLCILHEDGRVLSFRRKGDKEFSVITKSE